MIYKRQGRRKSYFPAALQQKVPKENYIWSTGY